MSRTSYYKLLLVLYTFTGMLFYKSVSDVYSITFYPAITWYQIASWGTYAIAILLVIMNLFLLDFRFGSGSSVSDEGNKSSNEDNRITEFVDAGHKEYSFLLILPMLIMGVMNIQWGYMFEGLATMNIFFAALLFQGAIKRGGKEYVLKQAKAGTNK